MAKLNALEALYNKQRSPMEFRFDMLTAPPLYTLLTPQDIYNLNQIAKSVKLSGKIDQKYKLIDQIMTSRGFVKLHAGTNRVVYRFIEDQRFVIKVAVDRVGLGDNPAEFQNQFILKPFVTKVFEVSPCGTVGVFERVDAIMSREEFLSVADDVFNLMTKFFIGKYVLEDVGTQYFMNWSVRKGFGPVLLDFPYVYELDGNKLYCNANPIPGRKDIVCNGEIDYDDGFNNLICTKCGRHYQARSLKKAEEQKLIIVGGKKTMKVQVKVGKKVILDSNKTKVAKVIEPEKKDNIKVQLPKEELVVKAPKEKVRQDRVESRSSEVVKKDEVKKEQPSEAIFNKTIKDEPEVVKEVKVEEEKVTNTVVVEEVKPVDDMLLDLDTESVNDDDYYDDEDEYEEYSDYVSNRQKSQDRSRAKQTKKVNNDFRGF